MVERRIHTHDADESASNFDAIVEKELEEARANDHEVIVLVNRPGSPRFIGRKVTGEFATRFLIFMLNKLVNGIDEATVVTAEDVLAGEQQQ